VKCLPPEIVDQWPDILPDIVVKSVPVEYICSITILFKTGKLWEVSLPTRNRVKKQLEVVELLNSYDSKIESIDVKIDINKIKKDSLKTVSKLLKVKLQ
jgi:hypothetical protein